MLSVVPPKLMPEAKLTTCVAPLIVIAVVAVFCVVEPAPVPPVWKMMSPEVPEPVEREPLYVAFTPDVSAVPATTD